MNTTYENKTMTTTYELGQVGDGLRILEIATRKYDTRIVTRASVCIVKREASWTTRSFEICGDYSRTVAHVTARATEKAIRAAHEAAMVNAPAILAEATQYYAAKAAA